MQKQCTKCDKILNLSNFYRKSSSKDGYKEECKLCSKTFDRERDKTTKRYLDQISRKYNLSSEDYSKMLITQNSCCAICNKSELLVVDHCHQTGKVRGLLCHKCNKGLGFLKDNISLLQNSIKYLKDNR